MRLRVRFQKLGKVRWTSHRDVARMWERACRRVRLPLAWTGGFSPRPKLSFGLALPTGAESVAEYLDLELVEDTAVDMAGLPAMLSDALPAGLDVVRVAALEAGTPSLQQDVTSCSWRLEMRASLERVAGAIDDGLRSPTLVIERERKGERSADDVRPAILSLDASALGPGQVQIDAVLATQPRGLRPHELVQALDPELEPDRVIRINQWIERDGHRSEPLPLVPADAMRRGNDVRARFGVLSGLPPGRYAVSTRGAG